jgi:hypothetical protein
MKIVKALVAYALVFCVQGSFGATITIYNGSNELLKIMPVETTADEYTPYDGFKYWLKPGASMNYKSSKLGFSPIKAIRWAHARVNKSFNKRVTYYWLGETPVSRTSSATMYILSDHNYKFCYNSKRDDCKTYRIPYKIMDVLRVNPETGKWVPAPNINIDNETWIEVQK